MQRSKLNIIGKFWWLIPFIVCFAVYCYAQGVGGVGGMPSEWHNARYITGFGAAREIYIHGTVYIGYPVHSAQIFPKSAGSTGQVLAIDANGQMYWAAAGAGDMLTTAYDTDADNDIDVAAGGTEKSSWTQYTIPYLSNTTVFGEIAIGSANEVLTVNVGADGYTWTSAGTGDMHSSSYDVDTNADIDLAAGGTNASLTDPNADRIMFWDDSGTAVTWLTANTGISITTTNLNVGGLMASEMANSDHGDFTYAGSSATLDTDTVGDNEIDYTEVTFGDFVEQTAWRIFYSNTNGDVTELAFGTDGQYLKAQGATSAPTWDDPSLLAIADDTKVTFGDGTDWDMEYAEGDEDSFNITTAAENGTADDNAMMVIAVDTDNTGMDADQEVFEIGKGAQDDGDTNFTELWAVDEDGDETVAGTSTVAGNISSGGTITSTASGDSYLQLTSNASISPSGFRQYVEANEWKVSENGNEEIPLSNTDSATLTGASWDFSAVTNLEIPNSNTATADAEGEIAIDTDDDQFLVYVGGVAIKFDFTSDAANYVLKSDGSGVLTMQADADTGGSPAWNTVADPTADVTIDHDINEETNFDFTGAFATGSQFKIEQKTGNPTGATLFEVKAADSDVTAAKFGDGTNMTQISQAGNVTLAGTASIIAGGVVLGDATPDAVGEFGYGSGIFKFYGANSEDFHLSVGSSSNTVTATSSTGITDFDWGSIDLDCDSNTVTLSTVSGAINTGDATSLEIPNSANPTLSAEGQIALDTDDGALKIHASTATVGPVLMSLLEDRDFTIDTPDGVNDEIKIFYVDADKYPHGIYMHSVSITLDADAAYTLPFEDWFGDPPAFYLTIESVSTGASDAYKKVAGANLDSRTVHASHYIFADVPSTDVEWVSGKFMFYIKGNKW